MSNLVTITSKFFDADGKALAGLSVKSRYLNSSRANLTQTDPKGYFKFEASPNRTVEILAKPPNEKEYKVFKTINSSKTSSMVHPIEVKLPKTLEEYKQINKRGLVKNYFKVVDCNGKIMANFPVQTRPKGKSSFERKTDKKGILEVASSPNRDIEFLVMDSSDKFVLKKEMNSGMGASTTILIKLDEAYSAFKSKGILELVDREGNTLTDIKVNVLMEIIESGTKKNYSISDGKLPIISHVGQELRFTIFKPDGKRLDSQSFTVDRINYRSLKLKIDVDINEGSTNKNEPKIDLALQAKNCGLEFRGKVKCTRYKKKFGPLYSGIKPFSAYDKWDMLISSGKISYDDQIVLMGVAPNEGNFDAVQSYDSEIITAGAMQKTINSSGTGELAEQIYKFKEQYPKIYANLFEDCGWVVTKSRDSSATVIYNGLSNTALKKLIRENCSKDTFGRAINCAPVESMIAGVSHPLFVDMQVMDFIERLRSFLNKKPIKKKAKNKNEKTVFYDYIIKDYIRSNLGKATILDHSINRPGHVTRYFGEALTYFFNTNSKVSENPNNWGANHASYERQILDYYGNNRGNMTHAKQRYNKTKKLIYELEKK